MRTTGERRSLRLNVLAMGGFTVVRGLLAFAASLVITRGLSTDDRGVYGFVTGTTTVLLMLAGLGIGSAMTRARAADSATTQDLYRASFAIGAANGLLASGLFFLAYVLGRASLFSGVTWGEAVTVMLVLPPMLVLSHWTVVSYLDDRIVEINRAYTVAGLLLLVGVGTVGLAGGLTAATVVIVWAVAGLLPLLTMLRPSRVRGAFSRVSLVGQLVGFGLRANIATVALVLVWRVDVFLVKGYRGLTELAMYGVAVALCEIMLSVAVSLRVALTPRQGDRSDRAGLVAAISTATRLTIAAGVTAALVLGLLAEPIVVHLYGERYADAAGAMRWLVPGIVALVVQGPLLDFLLAEGKVAGVTVITVASVVINIALNITLLPDHTFVAAAVASTVTYALSSVLILALFVREAAVGWRRMLVATPADVRAVVRRSHST
ncbi:MAG: oligosaccharide flippase family protein [Frankiaceae bacterium]|nr:oligosaccharide flippase family protein [Frankiaceae bacterium]